MFMAAFSGAALFGQRLADIQAQKFTDLGKFRFTFLVNFYIFKPMNVHALSTLRRYWITNPTAQAPLKSWHSITKRAKWQNFSELRATFNTADYVDGKVVFDIGGKNYRLIASIVYRKRAAYVLWIGTHAEYNKIKVKDV